MAPAPRKTRKHVIKSLRSICECFQTGESGRGTGLQR